jgi:hypothetical protein
MEQLDTALPPVVAARLVLEHAKEIERIRIVRPPAQDALVHDPGFARTAGTVRRDGLEEHGIRRRHVRSSALLRRGESS